MKTAISILIENNSYKLFVCITSLFSLYMVYCLTLASTWGLGITTDSITYIEGARSLVKHSTFNDIPSHYPPFYFLQIAFFSLAGNDILFTTRVLHVVTIFFHTAIVGYILYTVTEKNLIWLILGLLVFSTSPTVLQIHAMAWSEASYALLSSLGLFILSRYNDYHLSIRWLAFSSILIAFAFFTRYAGITVLISGFLFLLFFPKSSLKQRSISCLYYISISSSLILLWVGRNVVLADSATGRHFSYHPIPLEKLKQGIQTVSSWFQIPPQNAYLLLAVILSLIFALVIIYDFEKKRHSSLLELSLIYIGVYISFIIFSISVFDFLTPLDQRILYPIFEPLLFVFIIVLSKIVNAVKWKRIYFTLVIGVLVHLSILQFLQQEKIISSLEKNGVGFSSREWTHSKTLDYIKDIPVSTTIYTNGPDPIQLYLGRKSIMIPKVIHPLTNKTNPEYVNEMKNMQEHLLDGNAILVFFDNITWRWYLPTIEEVLNKIPLQKVFDSQDGDIFAPVSIH